MSSTSVESKSTKNHRKVIVLIVLGSGGHTSEMLNLLSRLQKDRFIPRFYIAAATDNMSLQKARVMENLINNTGKKTGDSARYMQIYLTSFGTTLFAIAQALMLRA